MRRVFDPLGAWVEFEDDGIDLELVDPERVIRWRHIRLRLIATWDGRLGRHRLYLTSVPESKLAAKDASAIYAMRWEIELLFRELKSQLRADQLPPANKAATEVLIDASLLALALSRAFHPLVALSPRGVLIPCPLERWTIVFLSLAHALLELLLAPPPDR